ncbi:MAG: dihydrofolate reductase family protein [Candidatus Staskawiczbacteria bacterium]
METKTEKRMKRPYALMLVAVSLDGKIAPKRRPGQANPVGPSLIGPEIMKLHNQQRASADAIMVGLNCILLDDSRLTLRHLHWWARKPEMSSSGSTSRHLTGNLALEKSYSSVSVASSKTLTLPPSSIATIVGRGSWDLVFLTL